MRKFLPWAICLFGLAILVVGLTADWFGFSAQPGVGATQILLIGLGTLLILVGIFFTLPIGISLIKRQERLQTGASNPRETLINFLVMGAWFGLVTGLVEGIALWGFRRLGWLTGIYMDLGNSLEIVWISAGFDLLFFMWIGLMLGVLGTLYKRTPVLFFGIYLFVWIAVLDGAVVLLNRWLDFFPLLILSAGLAPWPASWLIRKGEAALIFWRRSLHGVAGIALVAFAAIQGGFWLREEIAVTRLPEAMAGSPNILVIVVDTLRTDHLSSYGYHRKTSPNIDRLVGEGALFQNAISSSSWTQPAHASLVTGRYTYEHQAELVPLDKHFSTIGEALQALGYRTGGFSSNYWVFNRVNGFDRGFIHFEDFFETVDSSINYTIIGRIIEYKILHGIFGMEYRMGRRSAVEMNRSLFNWIDSKPDVPFFAFINYFDVHAPYNPPQPYRSKFSNLSKPGGLINPDWDTDHLYLSLTAAQVQGEIDAYDGAVSYVDNQIESILVELEYRDLLDNTLLIITSDHGEMFGEHGLFEHGNSLYREVIDVPLVIWWPDRVPSGLRLDQPVSITALPATLMDLIGEGNQQLFPGPSLASLWKEGSDGLKWPDPLSEVAQLPWAPSQNLTSRGAMKAIITPRWRYIEHESLGEELYDWVEDPGEETNLINEAGLESEINKLREHLDELMASESN